MVKDNNTIEQPKTEIVTSDEVDCEVQRECQKSDNGNGLSNGTEPNHGLGHENICGHQQVHGLVHEHEHININGDNHICGRSNDQSNERVQLNGQNPVESICASILVKPAFIKAAKKRKISGGNMNEAASTAAGPSVSNAMSNTEEDKNEDKDQDDKKAKKKKNRCAVCRKKVGLTGFACRCGGLYCAIHRYSDKHDCTFNYRELGAQEIRRNNPVVVGEKIRKI